MGQRAEKLGQGIDVDAPPSIDLERMAMVDLDDAVRAWFERSVISDVD